jgi:Acetyltransferase (GNAT) family
LGVWRLLRGTLDLLDSNNSASLVCLHEIWNRSLLRRACEQLRAEGSRQITLEVAVDNDRALALYTSAGFTPVITGDYVSLPLS